MVLFGTANFYEGKMAKEKLVELLLDGKINEFNRLVDDAYDGVADLSYTTLRGVNLRGIQFKHLNLEGAYLRSTDIRGLDLSSANLKHASIKDARISGVLFPDYIDPQELLLSINFGTRLRIN